MMVRQLSRDLEKEVELEIVGQEIELDKRILAGLRDPLVHLIRNSVDHGIELPDVRLAQGKARRGKLSLAVNQLGGGLVEFIISDDGSGIDCQEICRVAQQSGMLTEEEILAMSEEEKLMLIFRSSLSTSRIVTEISGRGLGMAVVEENVAKLGGRLKVLSEVGIGTQIVLTLPAALATFSGLQVSVSAKTFLLPCTGIDRVLRVPKSSVSLVEGEFPSFILDDRLVPICFLGDLLQLERVSWSDTVEEHFNIVLIGEGEHSVAFVVDTVSEEQEVLLKPLGAPFHGLSIYLGVTLLGIGKLAPVLNPRELINVYLRQRTAGSGSIALFEQADAKSPAVRSQKSVLVVDDTLTARMLLTNILASGGFAVTTAGDGVEALAIMANTNFDLVITDLEMPNMNGFELTQAIKQLSSTPVIIVTSMSSREERERGVAVGANAYFVKGSFDQTNLLEVIAALI
jgi:two-component system chemotaxis sensor kinase CheA